MRRQALLAMTTVLLALVMMNGTATAEETVDGIILPPEFPGQINNCSGIARICLPTGDITLKADNTSGFCTWTYNIAWGDGGTSSFVSRPGITERASHKYIHPGIYTIDVTIPPGTSSDPTRPNACGPLNQRYVVEVPDYRPETSLNTPPAPSPGSTVASGDATFTYTSNRDPVTFECSLDGSPFSDCPSEGQEYSDLADGQHTFQVRARDAGGNEDLSPATRTWTVDTSSTEDTAKPSVVATGPSAGTRRVLRGTNVTATFSEEMEGATLTRTTFKLVRKGTTTAIGAVVSYDPATKKATLDPNRRLVAGATYKATVATGATDLAGNALDQNPTLAGSQPKTWSFTVKR